MSFVDALRKKKRKSNYLNYGRDIILKWVEDFINSEAVPPRKSTKQYNILDIGAGKGADLLKIKESLNNVDIKLYAIENYEPNVDVLRSKGIEVNSQDIENEVFNFKDKFFDFIIINQVIEHTKEIFWIFSEISRVLKPGGMCIIGVPNLASFHNRIALLFGKQPTSIELLGPHVRGITTPSFKKFITADGYFKFAEVKGSNFYPFGKKIATILSKCFPKASVSVFFKIIRTDKEGLFINVLKERFFETPFKKD